ncbi:MAG: hypothetical protein M1828_001849 [Chrysothrix sp. TS-e1954]|nr:MAG: hypothetical protein M1828_001849 [Chrysothrix sp. TS-e1954]
MAGSSTPPMDGNSDEGQASRDANVFSDDYAESVAESYADTADGRSVRRAGSVESFGPRQSMTQRRATAQQASQLPLSNRSSTRSRPSMAKDHPSNPFDDLSGSRTRPSPRTSLLMRHGSNNASASRSQSSASSAYARSPSTVQSNVGPSHPYAMYPQGLGVSRSASVASTSTYYREPSQNNTPQTPAHPYALYPQNVFADDNEVAEPASIPVGFIQTNQSFHRRIGPEGEEQDIVGPDGHTEQLPPYTRYPEVVHSKSTTGAELPRIGETVGWEGSRQHDARTPIRSPESPSFSPASIHNEEASSLLQGRSNEHGSNGSGMTEKLWNEKSWKERRKTKVLGKPLWCYLIVLAVGISIVAVIAAAIGSVVGRKGAQRHYAAAQATSTSTAFTAYKDQKSQSVTATTTVLVDASAVTPPPTGVPTLQPGKYPMRLGWSSYNTSGCLVEPDQQPAWTCALASPAILLSIEQKESETTASIFPAYPNEPLGYGSQLPAISEPQTMQLVVDSEAVTFGSAYQFQMLFDKLVVLPGWTLDPGDDDDSGNGHAKRGTEVPPIGWTAPFTRQPIDPGDEPWFCYWNKTFLEVFFYVEDPPPLSAYTATPYSSPPASETSAMDAVSSLASELSASYSKIQASSPTGGKYSRERRDSNDDSMSADTVFQYRGDWHGMTRPPKVEERRLNSTDAPPGYCQQMVWSHKLDTFLPKLNATHQPVTIYLSEEDPGNAPIYNKAKRSRRWLSKLFERDGPSESEGCYCQWHLLQPYYGPTHSSHHSSHSSQT